MHMDVYANAQKDPEEHKSHFREASGLAGGSECIYLHLNFYKKYVLVYYPLNKSTILRTFRTHTHKMKVYGHA